MFTHSKERHSVDMKTSPLSFVLLLGTIATASGTTAQTAHCQQHEYEKLLASDGSIYDGFGGAVSVSGGVAVIGASNDDANGSDSGSAYVYRFDGIINSWTEEQKLVPPDGERYDYFGISVSVSGNVVAVGASGDNENTHYDSGSVYVYDFDNITKTWVQKQKLLASAPFGGDGFGGSVFVSGDVMFIGASGDGDIGFDNSGCVYVFRYNSITNSWAEEQKLLASDRASDDRFGYPVSLSDDVAVIGAQYDDDNGTDSGSAYVFRFDSIANSWVEEQKLLPSDGAVEDLFGHSVSVSGDLTVVGAYLNDDNTFDSGSAYVFRFDSMINRWVEEQKLLPFDGAYKDYFGWSVFVSGEMVLVGAHANDDNGRDSGSAYEFRFNGLSNRWEEEDKLLPSDNEDGDIFGNSISVSGGVAVIGAWSDDDNGSGSGSAYIFDVAEPFLLASTIPFQSGHAGRFRATDGIPFKQTWLVYSLLGGSCTEYFPPLNVTFGVCNPTTQPGNPMRTGFTDVNGSIEWSMTVPAVGSTTPVWFQAVQRNNITPVLATTIEP